MFQRIIFVLTLFVFCAAQSSAYAQSSTNHTSAKQAIMIDYDTGMVLFEKNADQRMPTSSMSKVMTMYLVFEALRNGKLSMDTKLKVSEKAWRKQGSKMFVEVDDHVKVEDLIRGVIVQSGNDATIVLAEGLAGSEDVFAEALTSKAEELGMKDSHFTNASGWPDPDHYSTARDLAILATRLISDFPEYYSFYSEEEFTYNNINQQNRNPLLYRDIGADGIKTGHTEDGGYGLMASGTRNGRRVVLVVNGLEDNKARAMESARLLEWGLKGFENKTLVQSGDVITEAEIAMGQKESLPLVVDKKFVATLPMNVKNDLKVEAVYDSPVIAPVKKGDEIGKLRVTIPRIDTFEIPLYAGEDVKQLGFFAQTMVKAKQFLGGVNG